MSYENRDYYFDPSTNSVRQMGVVNADGTNRLVFRVTFDRTGDSGWTEECEEIVNRMTSNLTSFRQTGVDTLAGECYRFAEAAFPNRATASVLCKLFEEIGEFIRTPNPEEAADIFILIADLFKIHRIGIESAVVEKLSILKKTEWTETVVPGVYKRTK